MWPWWPPRLEVIDDTERQVLLQVAVSGLPVPSDGLATGLEDAGVIPAALEAAAARLGDLSLVVVFDGGLWVHRWTAEAIRRREPAEDYRRRCERAGRMRLRGIESGPADIAEGIEATENFLAAQLFDEAAGIAMGVAKFLSGVSTLHLLSFSRRVRQVLPVSHAAYKNVADYEGQALLALGFTTTALERYGELVRDHEILAEAEPDRADYQRDLSVSYSKLGDLMRGLGRGEEARSLYTRTLEMRERLAEAEPDRADYQRHLSVSYNRLGDLMRALGRGEEARSLFTRALEMRERLAEAEPDRADYQRDLSVTYNKLGDLVRALGRGEEARSLFTRALEMRERLAEAEPDRADYQRDLSVTYNKLGDLMRALGRGEEARSLFTRALEIAQRLAEAEPDRADYQRDLSVSYNRLGDLMGALGRGEEA